MSTKICKSCKKDLPISSFSKKSSSKDGLRYSCKSCIKEESGEYYLKNKERIDNKNKEYDKMNKEIIKLRQAQWYVVNKERCKELCKVYRFTNKDMINKKHYDKLRQDVQYKLRCNIRGRLGKAISGSYKVGSAVDELGCSIEELKVYLESKFEPGMTWENWSRTGWHIDHIRPLVSFDLTQLEEVKIACHFSNLQPLWAKDNLSKGAK